MNVAPIYPAAVSLLPRGSAPRSIAAWLRRVLGAPVLVALVAAVAGCGGGAGADVGAERAAGAAAVTAAGTRAVALAAIASTPEAAVAKPVWTACAAEGQTCTFSGARQVRYGAGASYVTRTLSGGTACSNAVFGDPAYGVVKNCAYADADGEPPFDASQWTACAEEGGTCLFGGTRTVRYGTVAQATTRVTGGPVDCANAVFGDPAYGQRKTCWSSNPPVDSGWTACATEGQRCVFTGTRTVRYGAGTAFASGIYTGGVDCSNGVFGDPLYGTVKGCSMATTDAGGPAIAKVTLPDITSSTLGHSLRLAAQALGADGAPIAGATFGWGVADATIATIDAAGQATPLRAGYTTLTASAGGKAATGALTVRGPVAIPARSHYVGTNLAGVVYYQSNFPFADLMKSGGGWSSRSDNGAWGAPFPSIAADGTPTALAPGQHAVAAVAWDSTHYPAGRYTLLWDGKGTLSFPMSQLKIVESGPHRIVVEPQNLDAQMWVGIDTTAAADPVRNVRFLMPDTESTYARQPFNLSYLQRTAPFSMLRFMDWAVTNGSPIREWADRSHPIDVTYGTAKGVPIEVMIDLANTLHADPWFCIPHLASDDYVARFARLVHDRLDPTLRPHIEYSNEVWNTGFGQTQWASAQSDALGLARPWGTPSLFYAKRAVEIFKVMRQVYGANDAGRLVRVIGGQAAWTQFAENALGYGDTAANADVLAIAPYFSAAEADDAAKVATTLKLSPSQIVDQWLVSIRGEMKSWMGANATLAGRYRLKLKAYESGPGDSTSYFPAAQQAPMTALFAAANSSPRMKDVYVEFYRQWKALGGDAMLQYNDIGGWSIYGFWSALQYLYQDPATAPKYQGLLSVIAEDPNAGASASTAAEAGGAIPAAAR